MSKHRYIFNLSSLIILFTTILSCVSKSYILTPIENQQIWDYVVLDNSMDSIRVFSQMNPLGRWGKGDLRPICCPDDTIGCYYVYDICVSSVKKQPFTIESIMVSDSMGNLIPFIPYLSVLFSVDEKGYLIIDSLPYKTFTGSSNTHLGDMKTIISFEISPRLKDLENVNVFYCIKFGDGCVKNYHASYKKKLSVEVRPKFR